MKQFLKEPIGPHNEIRLEIYVIRGQRLFIASFVRVKQVCFSFFPFYAIYLIKLIIRFLHTSVYDPVKRYTFSLNTFVVFVVVVVVIVFFVIIVSLMLLCMLLLS